MVNKLCVVLALLAVAFLFASCSLLQPHSADVRTVLDQMLAAGQITMQQHQVLVDALTAGDWSSFWELLGAMGVTLISAWLGVPAITNLQRGKVTARKGFAPPGVSHV